MSTFAAVPLPSLEPGSWEWMQRMTASKVAAVLGLSPWESRFSLWHRMAGIIPSSADTDQTRRGHYLEDGVARWFADQHPEVTVTPGGAWSHPDRAWQAASPDRLLHPGPQGQAGAPLALLEIKTAAYADEWGTPGTDEIPPYYRAQVVWQLDTVGLQTAHVAVLLGQGLTFAEYRIDYNADEADYIRAECQAFMDSLPGGPAEQRPNIDAHSETYAAVRQLNPQVNGDVLVPDSLAEQFIAVHVRERVIRDTKQLLCNELADFMGDAKRAIYLGKPIASRQQRTGGTPYLVAARSLPTHTVTEGIAS